jgi:hypothetical protein
MAKLTGILGTLALIFAVIDLIHGQHNGDAHRFYLHVVEFISFFGFLCLLQIWTLRKIACGANLNRWLVAACLSLFSGVLSLILFGLAGGSFHGDGGPIATSFLVISGISDVVFPISLVAFVIIAISRKRNGIPILNQ